MHVADPASPIMRPSLLALPDRVRLPISVDLEPLLADLAMLEAMAWTPHFVPAHFDGDWSVLPLRAPEGAVHPILQISSNPSTTAWEATEYLRAASGIGMFLATLPCPIGTVRLMRLAPGSVIHEHRDDDLNAAWGMARLHVPLVTNEAVDFRLNGQAVAMAAGDCWYLRLSDPHSVTNLGMASRVHLVIDTVVDDWLEGQLLDCAMAPPRP
jgi:Aspartyl/Asparaginyl beta-hydroxylase